MNGWELSKEDHKALHKAGWTKEWNEFFSNPKNRNIKKAREKRVKMMQDERFASILAKGKQATSKPKNHSNRFRRWCKSRSNKQYLAGILGAAALASMSDAQAEEARQYIIDYTKNGEDFLDSESIAESLRQCGVDGTAALVAAEKLKKEEDEKCKNE